MDMRELKGLEIAARMRVVYKDGAWVVPSQSGTTTYKVTLRPAVSCTCDDFTLRQRPCKHVHAARCVQEREHGGQTPARDSDQLPKKPTYAQLWPAYNLAQATEKHRFQELLFDLTRGLREPQPPKTGRRPHLAKDAIWALAFKVYSTFSGRRLTCDLRDAHAAGYLANPVPGVKVCAFFENATLTPILRDLIRLSSLPLRAVETDFAPDSTGFSTSRFVKWFDEKYGVHRSGHDWVKVHIMTGVRTNIITAAEIHGPDANDSPILPSLLGTTTQGFTVKEVPADKGYSSVENIEVIEAAGATAYIAFKSNATGGSGGRWEQAFHYYSLHRDDFLKHYHKRSNAESTFAMVKAKFRDHVRSKTDTAMANEVYGKLLCHNICCLIQSQCELGIEPVFWPAEKDAGQDGSAAILPLVRPG
jgi:transposase